MSTADAPSLICDEVPAVCRPSGSTVLSPARPSRVVSRRPWSASTTPGLAGRRTVLAENRCVDRRDLALEPALVDRDARLLLRRQAEGVEVGAGDAAVAGDPVGAPRTGWACRSTSRPVAGRRCRPGTLAPSGIRRHRLDTGRDPDLDRAGRDHVVDQVGGLLPRAALRVDHGPAGVLRQPGVQPGPPHHPVGLLAGLGDAAGDDLVDQIGVDPGAGEHLAHRVADQDGGVHAGQPALPLAEGRADGVDDHRGAHGTKLEHVLILDNLPSPTFGM